jgi:hypothetical protein
MLAPVLSTLAPWRRKFLQNEDLLAKKMERTGIEPVTSGLQTHPITRPHLTPIDRIGVTKPNSAFSSNVIRHGSTAVCSHRARTGDA